MKIMQIVSCLELIVDNLFIFIHKGGIEKVTIQPPRKNGTLFFFFFLRKSFKRVQWSE